MCNPIVSTAAGEGTERTRATHLLRDDSVRDAHLRACRNSLPMHAFARAASKLRDRKRTLSLCARRREPRPRGARHAREEPARVVRLREHVAARAGIVVRPSARAIAAARVLA